MLRPKYISYYRVRTSSIRTVYRNRVKRATSWVSI